jgi:hypothetical protein
VNTPASNSVFQKAKVVSMGPTMMGMTGVSVGPISKPRSRKPFCMRRVISHSRSRRHVSSCMTSSAASTVATADGGMLALKIRLLAW